MSPLRSIDCNAGLRYYRGMGNILLAGTAGRLLTELTEETLVRGNRAAVTTPLEETENAPAGAESITGAKANKNLHYMAWNLRSPLSARSIVMDAFNTLGSVDEALVVFSADTGKKEFHEMSFADMEKALDESIKSFFFLGKEIFSAFQRQKRGALSFALHDGGVEVLPPPQAAACAAFRAFASSLFAQYQNEAFGLYGYYSSEAQTRAFARFLSTSEGRTEKAARRWLRFSGKPGLFSFVRNK